MEETIAELINVIKVTAARELPLVAQEILNARILYVSMWLSIGVFFCVTAYVSYKAYEKFLALYKLDKGNPDLDYDGLRILSAFAAVIFFIIGIPMLIVNTYMLVQVFICPRLIILNYLKELL